MLLRGVVYCIVTVNNNLVFCQITFYTKEFRILAPKNVCIHGGIRAAKTGTYINQIV